MKFLLYNAVYLILLMSCGSLKPTMTHIDEIFETETLRFALTVAGDTAELRTYIHPDLLYIHSNGLEEDSETHLSNVGVAKIDYQAFTPLQSSSVYVRKNLALLDGLVSVDGLYDGYPFSVNLRYTSTYEKLDGRWKLLRWQSTKIETD